MSVKATLRETKSLNVAFTDLRYPGGPSQAGWDKTRSKPRCDTFGDDHEFAVRIARPRAASSPIPGKGVERVPRPRHPGHDRRAAGRGRARADAEEEGQNGVVRAGRQAHRHPERARRRRRLWLGYRR